MKAQPETAEEHIRMGASMEHLTVPVIAVMFLASRIRPAFGSGEALLAPPLPMAAAWGG